MIAPDVIKMEERTRTKSKPMILANESKESLFGDDSRNVAKMRMKDEHRKNLIEISCTTGIKMLFQLQPNFNFILYFDSFLAKCRQVCC